MDNSYWGNGVLTNGHSLIISFCMSYRSRVQEVIVTHAQYYREILASGNKKELFTQS